MTREEAILHMTLRREELKHSVSDLDEDIKAFDMAIEALEQESCMNEEQEQIDFIQPKKVVGKLISVDVLDKIRAEIETQETWLFRQRLTAYNVDIALNAIKAVIAESEE